MKILSYLIIAALVCPYILHAMEEGISIYATPYRLENAAKSENPTEVANCLKEYFLGTENESTANEILSDCAQKYSSDYGAFLTNLEDLFYIEPIETRIGNEVKTLQQLHHLGAGQEPRSIQKQPEQIKHDELFAALLNAIENNNTRTVLNTYCQFQDASHDYEHLVFPYLREYALFLLEKEKINEAHELIAFFTPHPNDNDEIRPQRLSAYNQICTAKEYQISIAAQPAIQFAPPLADNIIPEDLQQNETVPQIEMPAEEQQQNINGTTQPQTFYSILKKVINWTRRMVSFGAKQPGRQAEQKPSLMTRITSLFNIHTAYSNLKIISMHTKNRIFSLWQR